MKLAVLSSPNAWHFRDLVRAGRETGHQVHAIAFEELTGSAGFSPDATEEMFAKFDAVLVRNMPAGSLQQIVFRMDALGQLAAQGKPVFNSPKSIEAAIDKYLTLRLLENESIPVPQTFVSQDIETAVEQFKKLSNDVVVKPIFGSMGRGIHRLDALANAQAYFADAIKTGQVIYQQEFIPHPGFDIRLLVINQEVFGMKRSNPNDWVTNISKGGTPEAYAPTELETQIALRASTAIGATFVGIDIVHCPRRGPIVIEANGVPGWRGISRVISTDIPALMLDTISSSLK
jgi:ribosomal protein S6--L-glutamate ligase